VVNSIQIYLTLFFVTLYNYARCFLAFDTNVFLQLVNAEAVLKAMLYTAAFIVELTLFKPISTTKIRPV